MLEKRRYPRLNVGLPVVLRHGGRLIPATMLNISCGGMSVRAVDEEISEESPLEIIFDLGENQKDVSISARIRHKKNSEEGTDIGVQFLNLYSLSHKAIQDYLRKSLN